jgi:hypothetical protein
MGGRGRSGGLGARTPQDCTGGLSPLQDHYSLGWYEPQPLVQPTKKLGIPWGRMFWPGGVPPKEAHKGLIDWH